MLRATETPGCRARATASAHRATHHAPRAVRRRCRSHRKETCIPPVVGFHDAPSCKTPPRAGFYTKPAPTARNADALPAREHRALELVLYEGPHFVGVIGLHQ